MGFLVRLLQHIPFTPWWIVRRSRLQRERWIHHVRRYYSD
jgi:hypothetical protein